MRHKRIKRLIKSYEEMREYWQSRADYYFKNHGYYWVDYEIEEEYRPQFDIAFNNRNIFSYRIMKLENKLLINRIKKWLN